MTQCFNGEAGANNYPLRAHAPRSLPCPLRDTRSSEKHSSNTFSSGARIVSHALRFAHSYSPLVCAALHPMSAGGGKYSVFEGGIRVNAVVSGGAVPARMRGTKLDGMVHIADWYGTFCALAGVDARDETAAAAGLPPVDSFDLWPMLSGATATSPRRSILVSEETLVAGRWKYVRPHTRLREAAWGGPAYPNASTAHDAIDAHSLVCPATGCLFDVVDDPSERLERSAEYPDLVASLRAQMEAEAATIWSQPHAVDPACRQAAQTFYGNFYGPWKEI